MTFEPEISTTRGLDHLATRLDPIIAERMHSHLAGHPWTVILEQLDEIAGLSHRRYSTRDLHAQLKMFTRRLGKLGFPFDDDRRTVSTLGSELAIVRNARSHGDAFSALDAWRAHDYCVRLLEYFGDDEGAEYARELRQEAFATYAEQEGLEPRQPPADDIVLEGAKSEPVLPDPAVFELASPPPTSLVGDVRLSFEPWVPVRAGDADVLVALPKKWAKAKVRSVAAEIVEAEGPIHLDRLTSLIAAAFGGRGGSKRTPKLVRQVQAIPLEVDGDKFVWPPGADPATWTEFRPSGPDVERHFEHISPVEIANAIAFLASGKAQLAGEGLRLATHKVFGRKKTSEGSRRHYEKALRVATVRTER